jgi:hypothetical protein
MKIAILLTGQLRTYEMLKYLHLNSLILPYNADVFLGIDLNNKYQCEYKNSTNASTFEQVDKVIEFFKPINSFIFDDVEQLNLLYRQYYLVKKTYEMLKIHSDNHNIKYDLIIRLRFDQFIFSKEVPIPPKIYNNELNTILYNQDNIDILKYYSIDKQFIFEEVNDNTIYVLGMGNFKHYKYANDQFFYHNHTLLEKMMNFYDNIDNINKYCNEKNIGNMGCLIECIFYLYITHFNNIILKQSNIFGIFIRQNVL